MITYQYTTLQYREIRLIRLHSGLEPKEVHCEIFHANLDAAPLYEALSYTWGDINIRRAIICNPQMDTLMITLNCELAIRRLRVSDVTRTLWIDAICINQDDIQERNEQVQLMRSIFRGARRVLVYLGEESTDSVNAMNFILDDHSSSGESNRPSMGLGHGVLSSPQQVALDRLLDLPWFERVWVLQEVWFAAEVEVLCGKHIVPWRALISTFNYLNMNKKLHLTHDQIRPLPYVIQMQDKRISNGIRGQETLLQKLYETRHCKSSDPRDKIHSLLSMASDGYDQTLDADYSKSTVDTFISLAKFFITKDNCLDVLGGVQGVESLHNLPTWVPDWSSPPTSKVIGYPHPPNGIYRACNNLPVIASFSPDARTLFVRGRYLDTTSEFGDKYSSSSSSSKSTLHQWARLASCLTPCPTCHDLPFAYLETIIASSTNFTYNGPNRLIQLFLSSWRLHFFDEYNASDVADEKVCGKTLAEAQIFNDFVTKACGGRRFFTTTGRYMGLAPAKAQAGDKICILLGGQVPYVLREQDEHYVLIGECYVHGIMKGEALQGTESNLQDFEIR